MHPYEELNLYMQEINAALQQIEDAKQNLNSIKGRQKPVIKKALSAANAEGDLKPLAQYLYLDAPEGFDRGFIKSVVEDYIRGTVQKWLCDGYTIDLECQDCLETFSYQVKSFSDLKERSKPFKRFKPVTRCPECEHSFWKARDDMAERYEEELNKRVAYLRSLPYKHYLQTEHWKSVRNKALRRAKFRCQLCNHSEQLNVHHRSYQHLGQEENHMDDVTVLCQPCHAKHHDISE